MQRFDSHSQNADADGMYIFQHFAVSLRLSKTFIITSIVGSNPVSNSLEYVLLKQDTIPKIWPRLSQAKSWLRFMRL